MILIIWLLLAGLSWLVIYSLAFGLAVDDFVTAAIVAGFVGLIAFASSRSEIPQNRSPDRS
jgi:hypothetical protein